MQDFLSVLNVLINILIIGYCINSAFLHLILFFQSTDEKGNLYLSLFLFLLNITIIFVPGTYRGIVELIFGYDYNALKDFYKYQELIAFLHTPFVVFFLAKFLISIIGYRKIAGRIINTLVMILSFILVPAGVIFNFVFGYEWHIRHSYYFISLPIYLIICFIIGYAMVLFIKSKLHKKTKSFLLISIVTIVGTMLFDAFLRAIWRENYIVGNLIPIGIAITLLSHTVCLKYKESQKQVVKLQADKSEELESKVRERTKKKKKENKYIENNNKQKTMFFTAFAHETKTPLTLISNYLHSYIAEKGMDKKLEIIKKNIDKLMHDMLNFLDSEKLQRKQLFFNHDTIINASEILMQKIRLFETSAKRKNIIVEYNIAKNIFIKIDPFAIERIINNIMENAFKFTQRKGKIDVSLQIYAEKNEVVFSVKDNGIGICSENQKRIFEPYFQIANKNRKVQGVGQGLAIVKQIVDSLDARIELDSELNKGSEFRIVFPAYKLHNNDKINSHIKNSQPLNLFPDMELEELPHDEDKMNILLVEDEIDLLAYLVESFKSEYNVFFASNGEQALAKLNSIPRPHIIISDIVMDKMDGEELLAKLQTHQEFKYIPFIFLTAKDSQLDKVKGIDQGAVDYIYKPFAIEELKVKIKAIFDIQNKQNEKNRLEILSNLSKAISNEYKKTNTDSFNSKLETYNITRKEKEIIIKVCRDKTNKEIANELGISESTIKTHLKNIFKKCNVQSRIELSKIFSNVENPQIENFF